MLLICKIFYIIFDFLKMCQLGQNIAIKRKDTLKAVAQFLRTVYVVSFLICVICAVLCIGSLKWKD